MNDKISMLLNNGKSIDCGTSFCLSGNCPVYEDIFERSPDHYISKFVIEGKYPVRHCQQVSFYPNLCTKTLYGSVFCFLL